uniref:Uncharacterized protein n=1 Tax=viral metagenome TaxID=1070528 RepID=A0A6C0C3Y0_9ZZZZ
MDKLPSECIQNIYEYDNTYRIIFNDVLFQINNYSKWYTLRKNTYIESFPLNYHNLSNLNIEHIPDYNSHSYYSAFSNFYFKKCVLPRHM